MKTMIPGIILPALLGLLTVAVPGAPSPVLAAQVPAAPAPVRPTPEGTAETVDPELAAALGRYAAWVESQMTTRDLPGVSIGIVVEDKLVWARGFGYADRDRKVRSTPRTAYRLASMSKLFTAIAVVQLRDRGKLSLDDPVNKYLPWFRLQDEKLCRGITIRQLLTHTAGLPRDPTGAFWDDFRFPSPEAIRESIPEMKLVFVPGTRWKYSNLGYVLLGEIVAAASGKSYREYIESNILKSIGLMNTSVVPANLPEGRMALGYGRRGADGRRPVRPWSELSGLTAAGGYSSTVEDLAKFASWQFRGGVPVLNEGSLAEMQRVHWLHDDWKGGYGLGFWTQRQGDRGLVGHWGWLAGYQGRIALSPNEKVAVIVLTNADDGRPDFFVEQAFTTIVPLLRKGAVPPHSGGGDVELRRYVGKYRNAWEDCEVLLQNGHLMLYYPDADDPKDSGLLLRLMSAGKDAFRIEGGPADWGLDGETAVFELDERGGVRRLKIGADSTYPVRVSSSRP